MSSKRNLELLTVPEVGSLEDAIGTIEGHKYDSEKVADEITKGIDAYVIQLEAKLPKMIGNISCLGEDIINISENEENRKIDLKISNNNYTIKLVRRAGFEDLNKINFFGRHKKRRVEFSALKIREENSVDYQSMVFEFGGNSRSINNIALRVREVESSYWISERSSDEFVREYLSYVNNRLKMGYALDSMHRDLPHILNQVPTLIGSLYEKNLNLRRQKLDSIQNLHHEVNSLEVPDF